MKNVTLAIDDKLLETGRIYARSHGTTLNDLIRRLLEQEVSPRPKKSWDEIFAIMDKAPIRTEGPWKREDLYDL